MRVVAVAPPGRGRARGSAPASPWR
jgi:hypothetical protein